MNYKKITFIMLFSLLMSSLFAQEVEVKGVVTDSKGEAVTGVYVMIKGTTKGTVTDIDGKYSVNADPKDYLVYSFIGMDSSEELVGTRSLINVALDEDGLKLDEVVVVGYGTQRKATLTGSVAAVKGDAIANTGNSNVSNSFAGRIPGVIASNRSGEPGSGMSSILIRGKGTLNDSKPLIVIDGVANRSGLDYLSPNDIESLTVLKDASAAIYGAQAANGVILVTTKRGVSSKPTVTYNGTVGFSQHTTTPNLMDSYEYMTFADEISGYNGTPKMFENIKGGYLDGTIDELQYADTDWMDVIFRPAAPQTRHSLSVRGGSEKVKYYISGDYLYQEPNYENTVFSFSTAQIRANIDAQISKNFKLTVELAGRKEERNNSIYPSGVMFWEAFNAYPYLPDYYPNGLPGPGLSEGNNLALLASGAETGYNRSNDFYADSKVGFDLQLPSITEGLSINGYGAFDMVFSNDKQLWDTWDTYRYNPSTGDYDKQTTNMEGSNINLKQASDYNSSSTLHLKLNYQRRFGDHNIGAFVAYEQNQYEGENFWAHRYYFDSNQIDYLDAGGDKDKDNGGKGYISARQNFFGRINYDYKSKYLLEFTMRYDGSMNFMNSKRWGAFPGISAGWRVSEEEFFKNVTAVNELKVRASWGKLGNDRVDPFQYLSTYELTNGAILGESPALTNGLQANRIGNPNITWEEVDTKNIGVDATFLNGKLTVSGEYFHQYRTNILTPKQASVPDYTGVILPDQNIGEISNQGVELSINHSNTVGDFSYSVGGNITYTKNNIHFFDEASNVPEWQRRTGNSIDSWLMYESDGIYQTQDEIDNTPHLVGTQPGDIKYLDKDLDGVITTNDMVRSETSNIPQLVFGLHLGAQWRGFDVSLLFSGQAMATQMIVPFSYNAHQEFYDNRWISATETPNSEYPRAFNKDDKFNTKWSDFWLYDASFLRLKSAEIAYSLPKRLLEKANIGGVRIFVVGNNLFTLDHIGFQDPESDATSAGQYYPQQKSYTLGVNISF